MNVYDFDHTIYRGDSTIDFYIFCLSKDVKLLGCLPHQFRYFISYKLHLCKKEKFKEEFYSYLGKIYNIDSLVDMFWDKKILKINKWYLDQKKESDVIISASPYFLLKKLKSILGIRCIIASIVDPSNGKLLSHNCYGPEKVARFREVFGEATPEKFYTDSKSDIPMVEISKVSYMYKRGRFYEVKAR